jgi:hypothetical protein
MYRSHTGFLSAGESLKAVLRQDWELVKQLGTTHIHLASHLRALLTLAKVRYILFVLCVRACVRACMCTRATVRTCFVGKRCALAANVQTITAGHQTRRHI